MRETQPTNRLRAVGLLPGDRSAFRLACVDDHPAILDETEPVAWMLIEHVVWSREHMAFVPGLVWVRFRRAGDTRSAR